MRGLIVTVIAIAACQGSPAPAPAPTPAPPVKRTPDDGDVTRTSASGGVTYTYRASRISYLTYALDCLAELVPCSRESFTAAFSPISNEDRFALAAWASLRRRYSGEIVDTRRTGRAVLPIPYHPRDLGTAMRVAGLGARDAADLAGRLALFAGAAEVAELRGVVERFAARGDVRWRELRTMVVTSVGEYVKLGERADVQALLAQVSAFYEIGDRGAHQTFDLVGRTADDRPTSAQQLGEQAVVEVVVGEEAANRYPVIAHEMFHAWFGASPIDKQTALVDRLVATGDPQAGPAWGLLDEVLATAIGNGLVARTVDRADYERRLAMDNGFYNDPMIDKVAKALMPALEKRLARGGSVYDKDFVAEYLAAVRTAFPKGLPPIAYLRPLFIAVPGAGASDRLMELANPGYSSSFSTIEESVASAAQYAGWGTAIFATSADLARIAPFVSPAALADMKRQAGKAFVYAWRKRVGTVFVFVADEPVALRSLVEAFAKLEAPLREGVIVP